MFKERIENSRYPVVQSDSTVNSVDMSCVKRQINILVEEFTKLEERVKRAEDTDYSLELINTFHQTLDEYDEVIRRLHELLKKYDRENSALKHENTKLKSELDN